MQQIIRLQFQKNFWRVMLENDFGDSDFPKIKKTCPFEKENNVCSIKVEIKTF